MTREEEIQEKAMELAKKHMPFCGLPITECIDTALEMGEWADEHPRKGLWDANKVLAWLSQNIESYCKLDAKNFNNLLFDLGKAMED